MWLIGVWEWYPKNQWEQHFTCIYELSGFGGRKWENLTPKGHVATSARHACGDWGAKERVTGTTLHVSFCQVKLRG